MYKVHLSAVAIRGDLHLRYYKLNLLVYTIVNIIIKRSSSFVSVLSSISIDLSHILYRITCVDEYACANKGGTHCACASGRQSRDDAKVREPLYGDVRIRLESFLCSELVA